MKRRSKDQLTISALFEAARKRSRGGDPTQESVDSERASSHSINLELNPMTSEAYETADLSIEVTGSGGSGDHVSDRVEVLAFVNGDERDPAEACRAIRNDVGELVDPNKLQDDTKLSLLLGHFVPDSHFPFPPRQEKKSGRDTKRYFQLQWLEKYNWLVYISPGIHVADPIQRTCHAACPLQQEVVTLGRDPLIFCQEPEKDYSPKLWRAILRQ